MKLLYTLKSKFVNLKIWQKIVVIIIMVLIWSYILNRLPLLKRTAPTEQFKNTGGVLECTMYYTTWCGYCKKAKPEWQKIFDEYHNKVINGVAIKILKIDGDKNPDIMKQEEISGFPTFKFILNGKPMTYDGDRIYEDFKQYIDNLVNSI